MKPYRGYENQGGFMMRGGFDPADYGINFGTPEQKDEARMYRNILVNMHGEKWVNDWQVASRINWQTMVAQFITAAEEYLEGLDEGYTAQKQQESDLRQF